jgi:hypothetical protein
VSVYEWKQRIDAMTERDRTIWNLAHKAVNEMGFACQLAAQGAENSQIKRERASDAAMSELFELLAPKVQP